MIDNVEFLSRIGAQDDGSRGRWSRAKRRAADERRATVETKRLQAATVSVISARTSEATVGPRPARGDRDTLAHGRALKQSALANSRETREEYLHEVEALAAQSAALAARIQEAQRELGLDRYRRSRRRRARSGPCDGVVVSGFGMRWGRMHEGIDIGCAFGYAQSAAASGTVIHAGWLGGYGNLVVVDHGNGLATAYAHASSILVGVGQSVAQGETVSLVGSTGNSSGPHLHFEVRVNGSAVDPLVLPLTDAQAASVAARGGATELTRWRSGERTPALVEPEPVAGEELVRYGEADEVEGSSSTSRRYGRSSSVTAARLAGLRRAEGPAEEVEREAGVDDVLDDEHVPVVERRVDVLQQPDAAVSAVRVRRDLDDVERVRNPQLARQVREEDDARLQRGDEDRIEAVVVTRRSRLPSSATRCAISARVR